MMKLDESEEAEGLPPACFRRSVSVKNIDVRRLPANSCMPMDKLSLSEHGLSCDAK